MRVLFATAELSPIVSAGGLGEAAAGLTSALRALGVDVEVVLPAYQRWELAEATSIGLNVPDWAGPARAISGIHAVVGPLTIIECPGIERPNPYVDEAGLGWPDNDARFACFSAAIAALADLRQPDVIQLNDWHTAMVPGLLGEDRPTVLTIHNLGYQGWAEAGWLHHLPQLRDAYGRGDSFNALAGAIQTADRVVAVSPTYAREILTTEGGMGLDDLLVERGSDLLGILNGIDTAVWDPATDPHLVANYDVSSLGNGFSSSATGKYANRAALLEEIGWEDNGEPVIAMVTRFVDQKGVDLAFDAARFLEGMKARLIVLGSGAKTLADLGHSLAAAQPDRFWFHEGFDVPLSHRMFAAADLLLMPSRFEPCGLAQMQAMAYGTVPVVTPVGGLVDTVVDADQDRSGGNGFVAASVDSAAVVDALHRAVRAIRHGRRRASILGRGMNSDWSWAGPAAEFLDVYRSIVR
jgi:starch synthase